MASDTDDGRSCFLVAASEFVDDEGVIHAPAGKLWSRYQQVLAIVREHAWPVDITVDSADIFHLCDCYFSEPEVEADLPTMERLAAIVGYVIPGHEDKAPE